MLYELVVDVLRDHLLDSGYITMSMFIDAEAKIPSQSNRSSFSLIRRYELMTKY